MYQAESEGGQDDPPLALLPGRSDSRLPDREVLHGPITPLGLAGLYLGNVDHVHDNEGFQSNIRRRLFVPRVRLGHRSRDISWLW